MRFIPQKNNRSVPKKRISMMNKLFISIVVVFILSLSSTVYFYLQSHKSAEISPENIVSNDPAVDLDNFDFNSDNNKLSVDNPTVDASNSQAIWGVSSADGIQWNVNKSMVADHASSPDLLIGKDGKQILYYTTNKYGNLRCKIESSGQLVDDNCQLYNVDSEIIADPEVVDAGGYYRMYYVAQSGKINSNTSQDNLNQIMSAVSKDGTNWLSEGVVLNANFTLSSPSVIKVGSYWTMAVIGDDNKIYLAHSANGRVFKMEDSIEGIRSSSVHFTNMGAIYNLYYAKDGIVNTSTVDAKTWMGLSVDVKADSGETISNPTVEKKSDNNFIMYYTKE